jgi:cell division protein FtsQ
MSEERPLPSNRRVRPRGVPLLPPDIAEQALAPSRPARGRARTRETQAKSEAPEVAPQEGAARKPAGPRFKLPTLRNPLRGKGAVLAAAGRILAGALLFLAIASSSSLGLYRYVSTSPRFAVKTILIEGSAHRSQAYVAEKAGVTLGKNVFTIDLEAARRKLIADPWIDRAVVDRKLPGTLMIQVTEREPLALVALSGEIYLSGRGGEVFKRFEEGDPIDLPLITGLGGTGELMRDREGLMASVRRAQELAADYQRLGPRSLGLQEVHATTEGTFELLVGREGIRLVMGKPPYRPKIERAARVLAETSRRKGQPLVIFLDNEAHPERVVARLR